MHTALSSLFYVKKYTLIALAGAVWFMAGSNVARLGLLAYRELLEIRLIHYLLSLVVFGLFGFMFLRMCQKHKERILEYQAPQQPMWRFFNRQSYIIMFCMMSLGIALRAFKLVPVVFIAIFYTGLGLALAMAGIYLISQYILHRRSRA